MTELLTFGGLTALTVGVTEIAKRAKCPERLIPIVALIIGFGLTLIGNVTDITSLTVLTGIAVGLSAIGLFSGVKNTIK